MMDAAPALDPEAAPAAQLPQLQAQLELLRLQVRKLEQERDEYRTLVLHLREENERLKRGLLGQKAERLAKHDAQLTMALLDLCLGGTPNLQGPLPEPEHKVLEHTRKKPVRKPFPQDLPRVHIEILPPEVQREGIQHFECIGSDTREVLERRPASTVIVQLEYKKFVRIDRERNSATCVLAPQAVELPIVRGTAGPGFLADTLVRRWQDHQPLHRLEGIYGREGLALSRSTLCTWHEQLADLARPLVQAMFADALRSPYLCTDATGVLILNKEQCRRGHFWVLVAPERHVLFRYSKDHTKKAVDALLPGYKGYLVVDAHTVYDHLFADGTIIEVGCWAHCRRYFFKSLASDPLRAKAALAYISALFLIEREVAHVSQSKRQQARKNRSSPLVDQFFLWCEKEAGSVLDLSPISTAIGYARNQKLALMRFLDDPRLPLHNNISELNLRRQVIGRKNWLFCGSDDGAQVNTVFVSLLASCRLHQIEPLAYLRDLLCLLPSWPTHRLLDLAPLCWPQTLQEAQTQQLLAANPFRRVVLDLPR